MLTRNKLVSLQLLQTAHKVAPLHNFVTPSLTNSNAQIIAACFVLLQLFEGSSSCWGRHANDMVISFAG